MEARNNAIVKSFTDKLIYVEPNFISGGMDNVPVPLEDLCVYVELKVECNLTKLHYDGDFVLQMRVENDTPYISLYNGVKYNEGSRDTFLSTDGYDKYTLSGMKEPGVEELFGVESIEVSYNSFAVPEIVIKFTDIKGAALHGAEELAHNSDGSFNVNNMSLCSRFLSCFFTVPYPRFTLLLKGYYGKPVYYDLTCADFRSTFNSKSGNYDVTVRLVGYSFALISDVNICSLLAAPYSQYKGKEYWDEQTTNGNFVVDGVAMPKLAEIVTIYNEKYASIKPLTEDETQSIQKVKSSYDDCIKLHTSLQELMVNLSNVKINNKELFIVDFEKNKIFLTEASYAALKEESVKKIVNVYVDKLRRIDTKTPFSNTDFFNENSWYEFLASNIEVEKEPVFDLSELDAQDEVKNELISKKENFLTVEQGGLSAYYIYYFDLNNEFEYIERQQKSLEKDLINDTKLQEQKIVEEMKTMFGFYPTIGNMTKILFAHLETFLYMFEEVKKFNNNSYDGLFPKILEKNVDNNGITTLIETWLGKRFNENDRAEVAFVHGLYNGIKNVLQSEYFVNSNGSDADRIYAYHNDLFEEHPFVKGFKNELDEISFNEDVFVRRFFQIAESANYIAHDSVCKEIAINDARFFHVTYPSGYPKIGDDLLMDKFLEPITKVESGAYSTIYDKRISEKIRFYDVQNVLLHNKKLVNADDNKNVGYTTLNVDSGWSSLNFKYSVYFKEYTAMLARISNNPNEVTNCTHGILKPDKNSNYDVVLSYGQIRRKYSSEEVATITSPSSVASSSTVYNHSFYKLTNKMSYDTMTLLTIPSFQMGIPKYMSAMFDLEADRTHCGIFYGGFLFGEVFYKNANIYAKAAMFLETFNWSNDITNIIESVLRCENETTKNVTQLVEAVPYFVILTFGAAIYSFYTQKMYIENRLFEYDYHFQNTQASKKKEVTLIRRFKWDTNEVKAMLDMIPEESRNVLQNEFKKWVNTTYKKWDDVFMNEENELNKDVKYNSKLYYATVGENKLEQINVQDSDRKVMYRLFRETHPIVQEMTKQFFELKWLVKDNMNSHASEEFYRTKFRVYAETFNEEMGKIFSDVKENIRSQYFKNITSPRDYIDLNVYRYLKQIWDRWIVSGNGYYDWKMIDVFRGENKRIHFIDPTYNDVTNLIMIDVGKFVEMIQSCKQHEDMPFLTFLSYYFRDNNCALHNVQNFINGQDRGNLQQIFDTVPAYGFNPNDVKKFSDLVVMFSFQGAESQEDSFNLDDESNLPPNFLNNFGGYIIPSFGVTYGMQNQNYFTDVDVSMNTPNITDESLRATFQIADENSGNAASENGSQIRSIGQDMYRVYSNHAYQCTVTMMGCAWIQPLMYFQLTNVPIFCGAYIIHKVTHNITPNNMVTKFVGTKVSKISMRRLENSYYYIQREITQREYNIFPKTLANITNNCNYAHFPPYSSDNSSDSKDLATLLGHFNDNWHNNLTYGIYYAIMLRKSKHAIEKNNVIFGFDVFLYNMWVANKATLSSDTLFDFFNNLFESNSSVLIDPTQYKGKENELVTYYNENIDNINEILSSDSGLIKCFSDIQGFVDKTANDKSIGFEMIDGCAILTKDINQSDIVYHVGDGEQPKMGDVVFLKCQRDGQQHSYWGSMYESSEEKVTIDKLIESFNKTMGESKTLNGLSLIISKNDDKEQKYVSGNIERYLLSLDGSASDEIKGQVFDMILQTYSQYLNHICWVVKDASSSHMIWDNIMIEMKTNNEFKVNVGYVNDVNQISTEIIESYDSLNSQFYMSVIKKYGFVKNGNNYNSVFDSFKNECRSFNKLNSKDNWKDEILTFFSTNDKTKGIKIKNCDDLIDEELSKVMVASNGFSSNITSYVPIDANFTPDVPSTQSFEGIGNKGTLLNKNQLEKITNSTAVASISEEDEIENLFLRYGYTAMDSRSVDWGETLARYACNHATGSGGLCATYVKEALSGALQTNSYKFSVEGHPNSACRYWQFLNYWGFTCIYHGMCSQYTNSYQNGDIIVSAGLINGSRGEKDKHGHIQIYYNGNWYCDKMYSNANVYSTDRSCFIFRIANRIQTSTIPMKILIDNGHGEDTPGKRSPDGRLREYAYTREIAERVVNKLKGLGYDAERIVTETNDIGTGERAKRVNRYCESLGSNNVVSVSIHCNAAGNGQWLDARGWSAFTSRGQTKSDKFAEFIYNEAEKQFVGHTIRKQLTDGDKDWEDKNWDMVYLTKCPSVLTENFFMDNKEDVEYLLSEKGKNAIVDTHVYGIINYIADVSPKVSSTSSSNANYKASESIINAIQHFEGFMPVWYPDSDSYSIGYGFKMTPDLSSKYPRTSSNTCMAVDRCGLIGKEKPNTPGCMTKQEANDYMRKTTLPTFENEFRQIMKDLPSYNQQQLDALFCLMYNIGPSGLKDKSPKLMQALREQNLDNVVKEMDHGGESHAKRRKWEQQLFKEHNYPPYP
jgi:N-acetylmuramoyl-L-alanine amidase